MSKLHVHIASTPPAPFRENFDELASDSIAATFDADPDPETSVLVQGVPKDEHLATLPKVDTLVIPYAGVPTPTRELLRDYERPITVYNLHHNAAPTAETAIALLMAAAKNIVVNHKALAQGDWRPRYAESRSMLLEDKRALLLGYGAIGKRIARGLEALGMQVRILRRSPDSSDARQGAISDLHAELANADALIIACPLTEETKGLIGEMEFSLMPRRALLVNVGRGLIVDQEALYDALSKGGIGAAGLDVWYTYPRSEEARENTPVGDFPFGGLPNLVMSPHCGGHSDQTERLRATALVELLENLAAGTQPVAVDLSRGY